MISESTILGIYITVTVFGIGVIAAESLGLTGGDDNDDAAASADGRGGGNEGSDSSHGLSHDMDDAISDAATGEGAEGVASDGRQYRRTIPVGRYVFRVLFALRMLVYFCAGFGPMGLIATLRGESLESSLMWAVPAGLVVMLCVWSILRFQQREYDSSIEDSELVGREGIVTVAIYPGEFGRVRIPFSQLTCERYARSPDESVLAKGTRIRVTKAGKTDLTVQSITTTRSNSKRELNE